MDFITKVHVFYFFKFALKCPTGFLHSYIAKKGRQIMMKIILMLALLFFNNINQVNAAAKSKLRGPNGRFISKKIKTDSTDNPTPEALQVSLITTDQDDALPAEHKILLGDRPAYVQEAADEAFDYNKKRCQAEKDQKHRAWNWNGEKNYSLMGLDDEKLLQSIAEKEQPNVYILDAGCGDGSWGNNTLQVLSRRPQDGKIITIFSVTGSTECEEVSLKQGNVTLHQLTNFKIENLDEELTLR